MINAAAPTQFMLLSILIVLYALLALNSSQRFHGMKLVQTLRKSDFWGNIQIKIFFSLSAHYSIRFS